jgi:serine/threonine-protein kinase
VSLELFVEPGPDDSWPSWTAATGAEADALISLKGGSLAATGLRLTRDGSARLKHLILVERGHLILTRCRLNAPGAVENGGGALITFDAPGSQPLECTPEGNGPFEHRFDRPTCRIVDSLLSTGGDVLTAGIGRGLVALSQCAVIAGRTAFVLKPGHLARHRLEADLWLDRCTVASEKDVVSIGPWRGSEPGPDRPWLVSTRQCAFFGTYEHTSSRTRESVMLRADAESLAHGTLFWQSSQDALAVPHLVALGDSAPPSGRRDDTSIQWMSLWGRAHVSTSTELGASLSVRPVVYPLRLGAVAPGDLAIDPSFRPGRQALELGVDLARLGITPTQKGQNR